MLETHHGALREILLIVEQLPGDIATSMQCQYSMVGSFGSPLHARGNQALGAIQPYSSCTVSRLKRDALKQYQ